MKFDTYSLQCGFGIIETAEEINSGMRSLCIEIVGNVRILKLVTLAGVILN